MACCNECGVEVSFSKARVKNDGVFCLPCDVFLFGDFGRKEETTCGLCGFPFQDDSGLCLSCDFTFFNGTCSWCGSSCGEDDKICDVCKSQGEIP